jgi:hypothetical protein
MRKLKKTKEFSFSKDAIIRKCGNREKPWNSRAIISSQLFYLQDDVTLPTGSYSLYLDEKIDLSRRLIKMWDCFLEKEKALLSVILLGTDLIDFLPPQAKEESVTILEKYKSLLESNTYKSMAESLGFSTRDRSLKSFSKFHTAFLEKLFYHFRRLIEV